MVDKAAQVGMDAFSSVIDAFMMESSAVLAVDPEGTLGRDAELRAEVEEGLKLLRDPETSLEEAVSLAFGIVDHYVQARWDHMVKEAYDLYVDLTRERSDRHRDQEGADGV